MTMDPTMPVSSLPESCISTAAPFPLLEISLISAQNLATIYKSMQTYAVAWINPSRKQTTRTDARGNKNPTWDDKMTFSLETRSEETTLTVEIYTVSWIRDVLVGMVKAPVEDLINPLTNRPGHTRFVALQLLRSSGDPQGVLNMGVALVDSTTKTMHVPMQKTESKIHVEEEDKDKKELNEKINLWRSMSVGSSSEMTNNDDFPVKIGSVCNASDICSDIGPSASIVAMEIAKKAPQEIPHPRQTDYRHGDTGSSIIEELTIEDARAKGYGRDRVARREKWRRVAGRRDEYGEESEVINRRRRRPRRGSDGSLISCLVCGMEFTIVCGGGSSKNIARGNKSSDSNRRRMHIESDSG